MELSQLQYFVAVSQCGKVKTAAEMLNISQSGISMAISRLEEELGVDLIEKQGRNIQLTKAGRTFASLTAPALASLENAKREIIMRKNSFPAVITISTEDAVYSNKLRTKYLQTYQTEVLFQQMFDPTTAVQNKLISGAVDFTFTYEPQDDSNVESFKILDEPALVQLSVTNKLADANCLSLKDFKNADFAAFPDEFGVRRWLDTLCARAGFRANVKHEAVDVIGLRSITWVMPVCTLIGWSNQEPPENRLIRAIPLNEPYCRRHLYVSYLKNRKMSPQALEFLAFMKRCAEATIPTGILPSPYDTASGVIQDKYDVEKWNEPESSLSD